MNKRYYIRYAMVPAAALSLAVTCMAGPVSAFYPSPASASVQLGSKPSYDEIQIFTNAPSEDVVILGELSVDGGARASLHQLMVAALDEARSRGADFVALYGPGTQPALWVGKMVPVGHGRSMFV